MIQPLLDRLAAGDESAADEIIAMAMGRLRRLAHKLLQSDAAVNRWEQTDDVVQNASLRLHRALKAARPGTDRDFVNLAALQIRRELADMFRHHYGPEGHGAHHKTDKPEADTDATPQHERARDSQPGPQTETRLKELHSLVERLPPEPREVFDLIFYMGLDQNEVATRLGISASTVKRRLREAKLLLHDILAQFSDGII